MNKRKLRIVYCTPALYMAGGVERVLTLKANYFAEILGYNITIVLTEGKGKPLAYPLSDKIQIENLDVNFEELWSCGFLKKVLVYLKKQRVYKKKLTELLMQIQPDITVSLLRREINFISNVRDGSKKIGELHVNRGNYRNFEAGDSNWFKELFSKFWMSRLIYHLKRLDRFVVLTEEDKMAWPELSNIIAIPNPLSFNTQTVSPLDNKRVIAVGRYTYQKGFDMLLQSWKLVEQVCPEWQLDIFGDGNRTPYEKIVDDLGIDRKRCRLNGVTHNIQVEYAKSSVFVVSSRFEGLSMAMLEAISYGLPLVAFACPCGPRDVVEDGENGFLVENGNIMLLADKLIYIMQNSKARKMMGVKAKEKSEQYKIDNLAVKWQNLFESL